MTGGTADARSLFHGGFEGMLPITQELLRSKFRTRLTSIVAYKHLYVGIGSR